MQDQQEKDLLTAEAVRERPVRERVGVSIEASDTTSALAWIREAEQAGVQQVWMVGAGAGSADILSTFAAAAVQTEHIRFGTAVIPIYPRHPLALAEQALALHDLAPGRLRLGVGPSHRPTIEGVYGIPMKAPLEHLREYVTVLRQALWEGKVDYQGHYYTVRTPFPRTPRTPILISALREGAYQLAGEISDGAISWVCPVPYLI